MLEDKKKQYCQSSGGKLFEHWNTEFKLNQSQNRGQNIFSEMKECKAYYPEILFGKDLQQQKNEPKMKNDRYQEQQ